MRLFQKHSLASRWFHWLNVPLLALMVWSGLLIYWANDEYMTLPQGLVDFLGIGHHLSMGLYWHFALMWVFAANGLAFVTYLFLSGKWRTIVPTAKDVRRLPLTLIHEMKQFFTPGFPSALNPYNAAQKIAYTGALTLGAVSLVTGLAIYKPVQAAWLTELIGGYRAARFEHFLAMLGFILFVIVHLLQVARSGWNNARAMVTGFAEDTETEMRRDE